MRYKPLEDYGLIGDLHTAALVGIDGSIDFMCFPRFDSPSIFAALLDHDRGGQFELAPVLNQVTHKQLYLPDSAILLTRFLSHDGVAEISDFMPLREPRCPQRLVRRAKTVRGEVRFRMRCAPRFDYGRAGHRVEGGKEEVIFSSQGPDKTVLRLRAQVPLRMENGAAVAEFGLKSNQSASFVLEDGSLPAQWEGCLRADISGQFKETMNYWKRWVARSRYRGRWQQVVNRSALTLKLLTCREFGSMLASVTFGLPEEPGGVRNWDYRYTWLRDASFMVYTFMRLGYVEEATAFMRWLEDRCRELRPGNPLQVMYRVDGSHELAESILDHFEGYAGSRPVRIGNGAANQLQLDVYGELMDAIYIYNQLEPISYDFWGHMVQLIDWLCLHWHEPDEGIWEVRGGRREFLYSRVMSWVAIDRALRLAQDRSFPAPIARWTEVRDAIYHDVYTGFWNPELKTFVQFKGSEAVDASALLMPMVKFISSNDPRWRSTLQVINQRLVEDSLVYRYNVLRGSQDGLPGKEGTFSMCSFWNVECLARVGDVKLGRFYFDKALGYANHVGLFAEEIGPSGEQLGNMPQAFTHLGLIAAAHCLDEVLEPSE